MCNGSYMPLILMGIAFVSTLIAWICAARAARAATQLRKELDVERLLRASQID